LDKLSLRVHAAIVYADMPLGLSAVLAFTHGIDVLLSADFEIAGRQFDCGVGIVESSCSDVHVFLLARIPPGAGEAYPLFDTALYTRSLLPVNGNNKDFYNYFRKAFSTASSTSSVICRPRSVASVVKRACDSSDTRICFDKIFSAGSFGFGPAPAARRRGVPRFVNFIRSFVFLRSAFIVFPSFRPDYPPGAGLMN